ncbi:MAG: hypothetical protein HC930_14080 [Hydrococcus sp. SU_1_0]|nr:hypothetical protein [Hydrococcus sp. SU_1_0]
MLISKLNNWLKSSVRLVLTVFICGMLFISFANPVQADNTRDPNGEVSLNKIQAKTDDVSRSNPRGIEEITKEAQKGLNAVQGDADKDKMISPDEANGTTVEEQADNFFKKLVN